MLTKRHLIHFVCMFFLRYGKCKNQIFLVYNMQLRLQTHNIENGTLILFRYIRDHKLRNELSKICGKQLLHIYYF